MNHFRDVYKEIFDKTILCDSQFGKNTLEDYQGIVSTLFQQFNSLCVKNEQFTTIYNCVLQKWNVLDKLEATFMENSMDTLLFQSEEVARELIQIVIFDVKKVMIENAIEVIKRKEESRQSPPRYLSNEDTDDFSPEPTTTSTTKKKRPNLPSQAKDILSSWFREHVDHPYPSQAEKNELSEQTGLSLQKVDNWFINERSRKWQTYRQR